jgi:hypothetical protein
MENVPREAWNAEGVKLILGDPCIFDRIDSGPVAREDSDLLTCWVWMEDLTSCRGRCHTPSSLPGLARLW